MVVQEENTRTEARVESRASDLKHRTLRGGAVTVVSQAIRFAIYTASTVVMARLLSPADFGLVGMVTAVTGFLAVFKDAGLSVATIQRDVITREQVSTLFWVNTAVGLVLAAVCLVAAPLLASFYREPKLLSIATVLAMPFVLSGLGAQHQALLRRELRFKALAVVDIVGVVAGFAACVTVALKGLGYWAAVSMPVGTALAETICLWVLMPWRPGLPKRGCGVRAMLRFGGLMSSVSALNYLFRNVDKVLIGRYWGAAPLGLYQKAYGLLMLPISQVNAPMSGVAVTALSRIQNEPERMCRYFLGGYEIAASMIIPIICAMTIFADEVVIFMLGPQWSPAVEVFRLLAPATLIGALLNPFGWLFISTGRPDRQFKLACVWTTLIIFSFALGLPFGARGVALAYSAMSCVLAFPVLWYAIQGTLVRVPDILGSIWRPVLAAAAVTPFAWLLKASLAGSLPIGVRAMLGCAFVFAGYAFLLLVVFGRWRIYSDLIRQTIWGQQQN